MRLGLILPEERKRLIGAGVSPEEIERRQDTIMRKRKKIMEVWLVENYQEKSCLLPYLLAMPVILLNLVGWRIGWLGRIFPPQAAVYAAGILLAGFILYWLLSGTYLLLRALDADRHMRLTHYAIRESFVSGQRRWAGSVLCVSLSMVGLINGFQIGWLYALWLTFALKLFARIVAIGEITKELNGR